MKLEQHIQSDRSTFIYQLLIKIIGDVTFILFQLACSFMNREVSKQNTLFVSP